MKNFQYNYKESEKKWKDQWKKDGIYHWDEGQSDRSMSYVIDTPPPTVSGLLHMGHVFSYTQTDFIARYKRMRGLNVFYPIGFDDNGLATERLVEKIKGVKASQMHREEFKSLCKEVVLDSEAEFRDLFDTIGLSVDWRQEYQTVSDDVIKISQMSFLDLVKKGVCFNKMGPSFWDPVDRTAVAQAEMEDKQKQGVMYEIIFDEERNIAIATTRPEMLHACVALFFHPDDNRFKHLIGQEVKVPIADISVPILSDASVEIEKGTGLVMCCTFGDIKDVQWCRDYSLPIKQIIGLDGRMFATNGILDGMTVKEARNKAVEILMHEGRVISEKEVVQFVKCAERSGAQLEIIPTKQWYIRLLDKKEELLEKGRQCIWNPEYMRIRYENWVEGLNQDWCISRQRYFGVPFPVWYSKRPGEEGKVLLADVSMLPCDPTIALPYGYDASEVIAEIDVMDTWATSSLTPQINARGINDEYFVNNERYRKLYPADLRPQAHEIIRTWSFYTLAKSLLHSNTIPWKELMISGWCLAKDKTKMSKSKGNVITPKSLIEDKSVDVIRYWASNSKLGVDIIYSEDVFKIGSRLVNKLCNAFNFASLHLCNLIGKPSENAISDVENGMIYEAMDLWILSRMHNLILCMEQEFDDFDYSDARSELESFFWNDFCDNYLEIAKVRIYNEIYPNESAHQSALYTLHHVLCAIVKLFAPFLPYVCEELHFNFFSKQSVHSCGNWPKYDRFYFNHSSHNEGQSVVEIVELVRKFKSNNNISLRHEIKELIYFGVALSDSARNDLKNAANALIINENNADEQDVVKSVRVSCVL